MSEIRVASFNASLNRNTAGQMLADLETGTNPQIRAVAEIIQRVDADVILINEFDFAGADAQRTIDLLRQNYLEVAQANTAAGAATPIVYPFAYIAPSNTGVASGFDLDNNGSAVTTPGAPGYGNDALGFGNFPGQFGMLVLSKHEILTDDVRTFQDFLWKDMPGALLPDDPATPAPADWYSAAELAVLPLSSKSHWDIPILVGGEVVHLLASHPTPPVFDGPEDRNGLRNHDEIRFWADYVTPGKAGYIYDDAGAFGGLGVGQRFVIAGDQNADPNDGDSTDDAILQLLDHPLVDTSFTPGSDGGPDAADRQGGANTTHVGDPRFDTADFADTTPGPGNLRADYVLPSVAGLDITGGGVFWPTDADPLFPLVGDFPFPSSDHRAVFLDLAVTEVPAIGERAVGAVDFLGVVTFPTGLDFAGTEVGGLSGITWDAAGGRYLAISDDRSQIDPARFYELTIDLADGSLDAGDVAFTKVTTLLREDGTPFPAGSIDFEAIALTSNDTLLIASEGDANALIAPSITEFSLAGRQFDAFEVPDYYLPSATGGTGIRNNLAFESLAMCPNGKFAYGATENALIQDGPAAALGTGSPARILRYDVATGEVLNEWIYVTDAVTAAPIPAGGFATNGLVELHSLDDRGTLLALERSFSAGVGNSIRLFEVRLQDATDVAGRATVDPATVRVAEKRLLLDLGTLGITLDNLEGMTFGPTLPDGRQTLVVVSDNNFSTTQATQVLALALDIEADVEGALRGGDAGEAVVDRSGGDAVLLGYGGNDRLLAFDGDDRLIGGDGDDELRGGAGDDTIKGGAGDDQLFGAAGDDLIEGGAGDDLIRANSGDDVVWGGAGDDIIYTGPGRDIVRFGIGDDADTVYVDPRFDRIDLSTAGIVDLAALAALVGAPADAFVLDLGGGDVLTLLRGDGTAVTVGELGAASFIFAG
jgi:3-phytase/alkaline phosphatase D